MDVIKVKSNYPKQEKLKDGNILNIRIMTKEDKPLIIEYFKKLPHQDMMYFRMDITSEGLDYWIKREQEELAITLLGFIDQQLVGISALHQDLAASSYHVGYIRLSVSAQHRKKGIASILAHEINAIAFSLNFEKVCVELTPEQKSSKNIFSDKLGFKQEAILKDHIMDKNNQKHDLIIMSNNPNDVLAQLKQRTVFTDTRYGQEY